MPPVIIQTYELPLMQQRDYGKLGNGIFLNPYSGGGCGEHLYVNPTYGKNNHHFGMEYHGDRIRGDGTMDIVKSGVDLFSKHGSTIANAVDVASGISSIVKTAKEINREDKKLYELKRINLAKEAKLTGSRDSKITPAHIEIMKKMREHEGEGIKII